MAVTVVNPMTSPQRQNQIQTVVSELYRLPSPHLLQDTREARDKYLSLCVPLYKLALEGNWIAAKPMLLDDNKMLLNAAIAKGMPTVLHVAAGANHVHFVKELVNLMNESDLALQDYKGNTAFCFAAAVGNVQIAQIMLQKHPILPKIRGGNGLTPLHFAALQGRTKMAEYLYLDCKTTDIFEEDDWNKLFLTCINTGIYDLALRMLEDRQKLALAKDENGETALHILAQMPLDLSSHSPEHQIRFINSGLFYPSTKQTSVLQLVGSLWKGILKLIDSEIEMKKIISEPSLLLFDAAEVGNFDFLAELMSSYPDLIWELDDRNRSIIHIAVLHRHARIFNLIHDISSTKDIIATFKDKDDGNNLLHLAAKLAPPNRLELVSGAAFQMKLELLWFEEVKKIMLPSYMKMKNREGITPRELFTKEHAELRKDAESWMKGTAKSSMLVSTVIATGVFSAAISLPGGNNDDTGTPNYLKTTAFLIFAISDATALISSSTSILIFLAILISRYAEYDFHKSLPSKLIFGLITLFISIASMMIAFSSAFFITYYHGLKWVPSFISVLSFFPILIFVFLQFQLFFDIIYSTYYLRSLFQPSKHMLY